MTQPLRLRADDDWWHVRSRWLGSPPWTFPFAARYTAWALMSSLIIGTLTADYLIGLIPGHLPLTMWTLTFAVLFGALLLRLSTDEIGIRHVIGIGWREIRLPKPLPCIDRTQHLRMHRASPVD